MICHITSKSYTIIHMYTIYDGNVEVPVISLDSNLKKDTQFFGFNLSFGAELIYNDLRQTC